MTLLDHTTTLPDGTRVRLRLPHHGDGAALRELALRLGVETDEVELARALRFDPRRRAVVVATIWIDGAPLLVGCAAIELGAAEPDTLLADVSLAPGVGEVLHRTLIAHASASRAA